MLRRALSSILFLGGLIILLILVFTFSASADTITVDDDGGADYENIQDAVNASNDGDTVFVYAGTYYENVLVNKSINLTGEDKDSTIINGRGIGDSVNITSDWVNVSGFTIINIYVQWDDPGIELNNVSNCKVANCNLNAGILLFSSNSNIIENNSISNSRVGIYLRSFSSSNLIANNTVYSNGYAGINLFSWCSNNIIYNNSVYSNYDFGILVESSCDSNTVASSSIYNSSRGLKLTEASSNTIINNYIHSNSVYGVRLYSSSDSNTIANNYIVRNNYGILLWDSPSNNTIENNTCSFNNWEGIKLELSSSNTITNNTCSFNKVGISISFSTDNKIYYNNIIANSDQALDTSNNGNQWDNGYPSGGNFWSDYNKSDDFSGPGQNIPGSDGIGDMPYEIDTDSRDNYPLMKRSGTNFEPTASFNFTPSSGNISIVFYFDAGECSDDKDITLDLQVRWDWEDDGIWDTDWTTTKTAFNQFSSPGTYMVRLEVMDTCGLIGNTTKQVIVVNEKPSASFTVNPTSGNITQIFEVNAHGCEDFEDSTFELQVRWDWEDDGIWDTNWTTIKTASHQYFSPGTYTIRLEVVDSGGLKDNTTQQVTVVNEKPMASFTVNPNLGNLTQVFEVNASECSDLEDPTSLLQVRWDWEDDGIWDTNWTTIKTAYHQYLFPGTYTIRLEVVDSGGLKDNTTKQITVVNEKPMASFTINPSLGNITQIFEVNASGCSDLENPISLLQVRWDWEDDGIWDTNWTTIKTAYHQYSSPGTYSIRLEVMDTGGLTDNITHDVLVTEISESPRVPKVPKSTNKPEVPFVIAAVATAVLASAILGTTDVGKYGFLLFFLPLYTRINRKEVLNHETRGRIRGMIESDPGIRYNELKKKLKLQNGVLTYHLHVLEREGYIKSKNNGIYKHFFTGDMKLPKNIIRMRGVQKIIFREVLENPGVSQKKIAQLIGGSTSTVNYNINIMAKQGIIELKREGNETKCFIIEEN
jgi:parallel beta-helix repeat protein